MDLVEYSADATVVSVATAWGPEHGGPNSLNFDLLNALAEEAPTTEILCIVPDHGATAVKLTPAQRITIVTVPGANWDDPESSALTSILPDLASRRHFPHSFTWLGHDVITGQHALTLKRTAGGGACALVMHSSYADYSAYKHLDPTHASHKDESQRMLFDRADLLLAVGPLLASRLADMLPSRSIHTLIPGLSLVDVRPSRSRLSVISFGRLDQENDRIKQGRLAVAGFARAIADAKQAPRPLQRLFDNPVLRIVGLDEEAHLRKDILREIEAQAGRAVDVRLLPFLDRPSLHRELLGSNLALFLSWHDGFGLVGWEAIGAGIPLIVSRTTGLHTLLERLGGSATGCVTPVDIRGSYGLDGANYREEDVAAVAAAIINVAANLPAKLSDAEDLRSLLSIQKGLTWQSAAREVGSVLGLRLRPSALHTPGPAVARTDRLRKRLEQHSRLAAEDAAIVTPQDLEAGMEAVRLDGGLYVHREIEDALLQALSRDEDACLLLVGKAGTGKTTLLWKLRERLEQSGTYNPLFLKATFVAIGRDVAGLGEAERPSAEDILSALAHPGSRGKRDVVLLDTADLLLHDEQARQTLVYLLEGLKSLGCAVVVASRPQEAVRVARLADKSLLLEDYNDLELPRAIEAHCRAFYKDSLDESEIHRIEELQRIVARGLPLREICLNPLTLRMLFVLYAPDTIPEEIHSFQLYDAFWRRRIVQDWRAGSFQPASGMNLERAAGLVALVMASEGLPEISDRQVETALGALGVDSLELSALYTRGILRRGVARTTAFFHQTFFEHAAARGFIREFGADGLNILARQVINKEEDLFISPVYEQALLVVDLVPGGAAICDKKLQELLDHPSLVLRISGIYVYCYRERVSAALSLVLERNLPTEEHAVVAHLLRNAVNWPRERLARLFEHLTTVWLRNNWNERQHIIGLLERFAFRAPRAIRRFIEQNQVQELLRTLPADFPGERMLANVLLAIAPDEWDWSWGRLLTLLRGHDRTVSLDLAITIVRGIADRRADLPDFAATEITSILVNIRRSEVRGLHELSEAIAQLWTHEWIAQSKNFEDIVLNLGTDVMRYATFRGLAGWLQSVAAPPIARMMELVSEASPEDAWLWLSCVVRPLLENSNWTGQSGLAQYIRDWMSDLTNGPSRVRAKQVLQALATPTLQASTFAIVFGRPEFSSPEAWLNPEVLGPYIAHGIMAEHPGAKIALEQIISGRPVPSEVRDSLLSRLTNHVKADERLARIYLQVSLASDLPEGFGAGLTHITQAWPQLISEFGARLEERSTQLVEHKSSRLRAASALIVEKLVACEVTAPERPGSVLKRLSRERSWDVRAVLVSVFALSVKMSSEPLHPLLQELKRLVEDRSPEVRSRSILSLSRITARSPSDACTFGLSVLQFVLDCELQSDRVGEVGLILAGMAERCPETAQEFILLLLRSPQIRGLSGQAKRSLLHRLRRPVRRALEKLSRDNRREVLSASATSDKYLGRLVFDALLYLDFEYFLSDFDSFLSDPAVDGDLKELIRRHKYLRQRTAGGNQWPELYQVLVRRAATA